MLSRRSGHAGNHPSNPPDMIDPLTFPIPTEFTTLRLMLRPFRVSDAPALHEALAESIVELRQHLWFLPWVAEEPTLSSAEVRCRRAEGNFLLRNDLAYLAFNRSTARLVASVGLHRTDWTLPSTEVGYWVRRGETGKGYASECVNALTDWALNELRAVRVALVTDDDNVASRAVAERCGFTLEGLHRHTTRGPDGALRHSAVYARLPQGS